jgi:hypothetical protein
MPAERRRYLVHITLGTLDTNRRLGDVVQQVQRTLTSLSHASVLAYRADQGRCFGYIAASDKPAATIRAALDGNGGSGTGLENGDTVFVLECGQDFSQHGHSALLAWLQHH